MSFGITTAISLGFRKGDIVETVEGEPAILISDVDRANPIAEVWGFEQESREISARDIRLIEWPEFVTLTEQFGHTSIEPKDKTARQVIAYNTEKK